MTTPRTPLVCLAAALTFACAPGEQLDTTYACVGNPCTQAQAARSLATLHGRAPAGAEQIDLGAIPSEWRARDEADIFCGYRSHNETDGWSFDLGNSVGWIPDTAEVIFQTAFTLDSVGRAVYMAVHTDDSGRGECSTYISWQSFFTNAHNLGPFNADNQHNYGAECVFLPAAGCTIHPSPSMEIAVVESREFDGPIPLLRVLPFLGYNEVDQLVSQPKAVLTAHSANPEDVLLWAQVMADALVNGEIVPDQTEGGYAPLTNCEVLCRSIGAPREFIEDARDDGRALVQVIRNFGGALYHFAPPLPDELGTTPSRICGTSYSPYRFEENRRDAWLAKLAQIYPGLGTGERLNQYFADALGPIFGQCIGGSSDPRDY